MPLDLLDLPMVCEIQTCSMLKSNVPRGVLFSLNLSFQLIYWLEWKTLTSQISTELMAIVACPAWGVISDRLGVRMVGKYSYHKYNICQTQLPPFQTLKKIH